MYVRVPHDCNVHRGQKKVLGRLELDLKTVNNHMWVLGTGSMSSARTISALTPEPSLQLLANTFVLSLNVWVC